MAVAPSGSWIAVWSTEVAAVVSTARGAAIYETDGAKVSALDLGTTGELFPTEPAGQAVETPCPDGGFAIAWKAHTGAAESAAGAAGATTGAIVARFGPSGARLAGPVRVDEGGAGHRRPFGIAADAGKIVVGWDSENAAGDLRTDVKVRVLTPALTPRSEVVRFVEVYGDLDQTGVLLTLRPDGRAVVAWNDWERGLLEQIRYEVVVFQTFDSDGTRLGFPFSRRSSPRVAAAGRSFSWLVGTRPQDDALEVSPVDFTLGFVGPAFPLDLDFDAATREAVAATDPADRLLVVLDRWPRTATGAVTDPVVRPPPDIFALTSPELPGFRVWVRIGGSFPEPRWGVEETPCLAETLCASGAVPGRTEVLVRVVGPKANGFLWPTLVKLTTSEVDVWIERAETGEVRHYFLPGASPGADVLNGLFDRFGFPP
jgi:hypothetical protein